MTESKGRVQVAALGLVLVALGQKDADTEDAPDGGAHLRRFGKVIVLGDQDLCEGLGADGEEALAVEEALVFDQTLIGDRMYPIGVL